MILDIPIFKQKWLDVVSLRHDFPDAMQRAFLDVYVYCCFDHGFAPFELARVVDLAVWVFRVHAAIFQLFAHDVLLAGVVESACDAFGDFDLVVVVDQLNEFVEVVHLKGIQFVLAVFEGIEEELLICLALERLNVLVALLPEEAFESAVCVEYDLPDDGFVSVDVSTLETMVTFLCLVSLVRCTCASL